MRSLLVPLLAVFLPLHAWPYIHPLTVRGHSLFSECVTRFKTILWNRELTPPYRSRNRNVQNSQFPMTVQSLSGAVTSKKSDSAFFALNHYLPLYYSYRVRTWASLWSSPAKWGSYTEEGSLGRVYKTWERKEKLPKGMTVDPTQFLSHTLGSFIHENLCDLYKNSAKWELSILIEVETEP